MEETFDEGAFAADATTPPRTGHAPRGEGLLDPVNVDRFRPEDLPGTYRVCLATGDAGKDAARLHADPNLLGHLYVGPYVCLEPQHAFVLRDGAEVLGYALGALDTASFEERAEKHWWPPLRAMYLLDTPRCEADAALVRAVHAPDHGPAGLLTSYPSHLHIDLLPRAQGRGHGRAMLEEVVASLFRAGSTGIHLGVARRNERAIGFYEHLGFQSLQTHGDGLVMGRVAP